MNTGYLVVFNIIIATAPTLFARVLNSHDYNQVDVTRTNDTETKRILGYDPVPPKLDQFRYEDSSVLNRDVLAIHNPKNSFLEQENWKEQIKDFNKKKIWKSSKKYAKRDVESKVENVRSLDKSSQFPEDLSLKSNTHYKGCNKLHNDGQKMKQMSTTSESLLDTSKALENSNELELTLMDVQQSKEIMNVEKSSQNMFAHFTKQNEAPPEEKIDINPKTVDALEYYKGEPTMGQKLAGPNIKELMERFKERDDAHRNENMSTGFTRISDSTITSEKSILSQKQAKERIVLL